MNIATLLLFLAFELFCVAKKAYGVGKIILIATRHLIRPVCF